MYKKTITNNYIISICIILIYFTISIIKKSIDFNISTLDGLNAYIYIVIMPGPLRSFTALLAALLFSIDLDSPEINNITKYYMLNCKLAFHCGLVFIIANTITLLISCILCTGDQIIISLPGFGLFSELRENNTITYILIYIVHSFVFGFVFNLLARGLCAITKNIKLTLFIGILIYNLHNYIPDLSGTPLYFISDILYFVPYFVYEVLEFDITIQQRLLDFSILFIFALSLLFYSYKKDSRRVNDYGK